MSTLRTYAQLCRLPAVFTAMADVFMGYFVVRGDATVRSGLELAGLVVCSSCLYLAGMVLNDVFDRDVDARERPNRPIPSGRVSLRQARTFAGVLIACGLFAGLFVEIVYQTGLQILPIALLLLGCIFLYDGWAKKTPFGPIAMGSCRILNVLLGAGFDSTLAETFHREVTPLAFAMGIYVAGVTWFAKKEAETSARGGLIFGQGVLSLGLALMAVWITPQFQPLRQNIVLWFNTRFDSNRPLVMLGVIAFVVNRRAFAAVSDPRPPMVQSAVRIMLLSIITIDATLIDAALGDPGVPIALGVASLLIPSFLLGRWMTMT